MKNLCILLILLCTWTDESQAQRTPEATYEKYLQLTSLFGGDQPYQCDAIVEIRYDSKGARAARDTSRLIYQNRQTYYKSARVERLEGPQGELIINHELRSVLYHISDSIRAVIQKEAQIKTDPELEAMLDPDGQAREEAAFKEFLIRNCEVTWEEQGDEQEISFMPKQPAQSLIMNIRIRFKGDRVIYYEYASRDVYSTDWKGNSKFRVVKTIYDNISYEQVPEVPASLSDYLSWNGWTVKLKKYSNYELSVL